MARGLADRGRPRGGGGGASAFLAVTFAGFEIFAAALASRVNSASLADGVLEITDFLAMLYLPVHMATIINPYDSNNND